MNPRLIIVVLLFLFHSSFSQTEQLRRSIGQIIQSKNATVGIAISGIESKDTLSINGNKMFPMFSVVKFFTAMAVLNKIDKGEFTLDKKITVNKADLNPDTHSPMRDSMPKEGFEISVGELIRYSVTVSDNIAYEKLAELIGGIKNVNTYIGQLNVKGVSIVSTYKEGMEATLNNQTTPIAAVTTLKKAYTEKLFSKKSYDFLWNTMFATTSAPDRLKGLLPEGTKVAHKTGTGDGEDGIFYGFNDIGIITLPSGKHFAIAVLITESKESDKMNAKIIAEISKTVYDYFNAKSK